MINWNREFCTTLVTCFTHFLWQGLLVGSLFVALMWVLRHRSPQSRYSGGLVCLGLLSLCVPITFLVIYERPSGYRVTPSAYIANQEYSAATTPKMLISSDESRFTQQQFPSFQTTRTWISNMDSTSPWLLATYFVGLMFFTCRLGLGIYFCRDWRRKAAPVIQPHLLASINKVGLELSLAVLPEVLWCREVAVPSVVGLLRPVVLLPLTCATGLRPEQIEQILIHEFTHIQRHDHLINLMQNTLEAVLFFHPVVWWISRRVRLERECCCDAAVIASGRRPREYANCLIDVASLASSMDGVATPIAIAATGRTSELRTRIDRLLGRDKRERSQLIEGGSVVTIGAVLTFCFLLSVQRQTMAHPDDNPPTATAASQTLAEPADEADKTDKKQPQQEAAAGEIAGIVVDEDGNPLEGVLVDAWTWYPGTETRTDKRGAFRLNVGDERVRAEVRFSKAEYSPHYVVQQETQIANLKITLDRKTYIEGRLLDPAGKPVPNANIKGEQGPKMGDGVLISTVTTETKTDAAGRYRMYVFPDTYQMKVSIPGSGVARVPDVAVTKHQAQSLDIQLEKGVRFLAHAIDADSGEPVEGVVLYSWVDPSVVGKSDATGQIVIDGMLPGDFEFQVGSGDAEQYNGNRIFTNGALGRWWSTDANVVHQRKTIEPDGWQRNFDHLTFDLFVGMEPVTIEVEQGVMFRGKVFDPDGNPVAGATVAPAKTGSGNSLTGDTRYSATTEPDGSYEVVMPAGNTFQYNLMVHDGKYEEWRKWANGVSKPFESVPGQTFNDFNLTLSRPCTVKGRVLSRSGGNVKGVRISSQAIDLLVNRYYDPTTATGDDGTFELKFVRPGQHNVRVEPFYLLAQDGPPGSWRTTVELEAGEVVDDIELFVQ